MLKQGKILHRGMWQVPYKAVNVLCSDGVQRTCKTAIEADTVWTLPASVQVKGKTVTGFIHHTSDVDGVMCFTACKYRKNGNLLPDINYAGWQELVAKLR